MAYCTQADVENKVGGPAALVQLCDFQNTGSLVLNSGVLLAAIESADSMIDSYINKQVMVPIDPLRIPPAIKHLSARLTAYELRQARRMVDPETHGKTQEADLKLLDMMKSGEITLGLDPAPLKASARIDAQSDRPLSKEVSRSRLRGFS